MTEKKREDVSKKLVGLSNSRLKYPNLGRIDENDEFRCSEVKSETVSDLFLDALQYQAEHQLDEIKQKHQK